MSRATLIILCLALATLGVDQVSKVVAERLFLVEERGDEVADYQGKRAQVLFLGSASAQEGRGGDYLSLNLNYIRNPGAAWGLFAWLESWQRRLIFLGLIPVVMAVLYWMWRRLEPEDWASRLSLALIAAGGLGNTLDRIRLGYVIDWIEIHWKILGWRYYFPNFNVADVAVVSGVLILAWSVALRPEKKENPCSNGS